MPDFHRLENPPADYLIGAGTPLPTGYDYINNDPANPTGSAAGNRAQISLGPKASGFNSGTYFVGWREPGLSAVVNRLAHALSQNTDYLDNQLRRRVAIPKTQNTVTVGGETYIQIMDWVWCGDDVGDDVSLLVQVLENDGTYAEASYHLAGSRFSSIPTAIKDSTGAVSVVGNGWVENPRVYLSLAAAPQNLLLVYGARSSYLAAHAGAYHEKHHFSTVSWDLLQQLFLIKGVPTGAWTDGPVSSLALLKAKTLNHAYRASHADNEGTPGLGATVARVGKAVTVTSRLGNDLETLGTPKIYVDPINACFAASMHDVGGVGSSRTGTGLGAWSYGSVGFATYGTRWDIKGKRDAAPSYASFLALEGGFGTSTPASVSGHLYMTNIPAGSSAVLTPIADGAFTLELAGTGVYPNPYFWHDLGAGDKRTSIIAGKDIIEVTNGVWTRSFVVFALHNGQSGLTTDNKKAVLYPIDAGTMADISLATAVTVTWHGTRFAVGHGAARSKVRYDGLTPPGTFVTDDFLDFGVDGLFLAAAPRKTNNANSVNDFLNPISTQPLAHIGGEDATRIALQIGLFNQSPSVAKFEKRISMKAGGEIITETATDLVEVAPTGITLEEVGGPGAYLGSGVLRSNKVRNSTLASATISANTAELVVDLTANDKHVITASGSGTWLMSKINLELGLDDYHGFGAGATFDLYFVSSSSAKFRFREAGAVAYDDGFAVYIEGLWQTRKNAVNGGSLSNFYFRFESPSAMLASNTFDMVDHFHGINIGTYATPIIAVTVRRYRRHG